MVTYRSHTGDAIARSNIYNVLKTNSSISSRSRLKLVFFPDIINPWSILSRGSTNPTQVNCLQVQLLSSLLFVKDGVHYYYFKTTVYDYDWAVWVMINHLHGLTSQARRVINKASHQQKGETANSHLDPFNGKSGWLFPLATRQQTTGVSSSGYKIKLHACLHPQWVSAKCIYLCVTVFALFKQNLSIRDAV